MYRVGRGGFAICALMLALLATGTTVSTVHAAAKTTAQLEAVRAVEGPAGSTRIEVALSRRPTFTTFKLEHPARVVLDVSGARASTAINPFDAGTFAVGTVSVNETDGDGGPRTRIVVTLRRPADYDVEPLRTGLVLVIRPRDVPVQQVAKAEPARTDHRNEAAVAAVRAAEQKQIAAEQKQAAALAALAAAEAKRIEFEARRQSADKDLAAAKQAAEQAASERAALAQQTAQERAALEQRSAQLAKQTAQTAQERAALAQQTAQERAALAQQTAQERAALAQQTAQERAALAAERAELEKRGRALENAEAAARRAQQRLAAETVSLNEARKRAAQEQSQRVTVERSAQAGLIASRDEQSAQRRRLSEAERALADRQASMAQATRELEQREAAAAKAARELDVLAKKASAGQQDLARARGAEAERLNQTVARRTQEEQRLAEVAAARKREEARRAEAESQRGRLEADRARLETERARIEAERTRLLAEVERLRRQAERAPKAVAATHPAPKAIAATPVAPKAVAATPASAPAARKPGASPGPIAPRLVVAPLVGIERVDETVVAGVPRVPEAPPGLRSITLRPPSRVENIDFIDEPTRCSIIIDLDEPSAFAIVRGVGRRVSLRLYKTFLPESLERTLDATEFLGPIRIISSYRDPSLRGAVRIDVEMAEEVPNDVRLEAQLPDFEEAADGVRLRWNFSKSLAMSQPALSLGTKMASGPGFVASLSLPRIAAYSSQGWIAPVMVAQALAQAPTGTGMVQRPGTGKKRFTGRRIDLDFKGADIHNILRLLADVGGVNIVTSDDVKGEVTIKMRDVPWDQALDVVLRQKQLGQVREGNLVRVAPLQVLEKELEQEIARQKQITEVLPTETRLIGVSYAEAKQLTDRVRDLLSPRGKISVDERTNTLIVSDVGRNLALVEELVRNLDTQTSQVVIEARIVEARSTFVRQIGVQWGGTGFADMAHANPTGLVFPNSIGIGGGATDGKTPVDGLTSAAAANPNFAVNLPAAVGTGSGGAIGLTMGSVAGAFNLNLRLSAMESTGQVRILSSPRISTLDNTEASIEQGVSIPISVVSAQGVQTVFVDAKLNLTVRPHVTNEGTVMMEIKVTRNEPDFVNTGARGDPTILKKEANTKMLVRDGDTAVIGGIYQRNSGLSYAKVPFLADLPVLGYLFRARRENDDRTEFLVFITPRIANRARSLGQ